ncbi:MAG: hypothetical protein ABUT20_08705 [Bacteroidota bacterium]
MKKIAPDKWKHFYVGIALGAVIYGSAIFLWPLQPLSAFIISSAVLIAICYGFELLSLVTGKGHYELMDAVAGIVGGFAGIGIVILLKAFL